MIKFRYRKEASIITGEVLRPVADVILESGRSKVETAMYIDSGADITMVPLELGKALGFKQFPTEEIREIKGVSGGGVPYILKKANIALNGKKLKIRLAWALHRRTALTFRPNGYLPKIQNHLRRKTRINLFHLIPTFFLGQLLTPIPMRVWKGTKNNSDPVYLKYFSYYQRTARK